MAIATDVCSKLPDRSDVHDLAAFQILWQRKMIHARVNYSFASFFFNMKASKKITRGGHTLPDVLGAASQKLANKKKKI